MDLVVYPCDELQNSKARNVYRSNTSRQACDCVCVCGVCVCVCVFVWCVCVCVCLCESVFAFFVFFALSNQISTNKIS